MTLKKQNPDGQDLVDDGSADSRKNWPLQKKRGPDVIMKAKKPRPPVQGREEKGPPFARFPDYKSIED